MKVVDYRVNDNQALDADRLFEGDHVLLLVTTEDQKAGTVDGWFVAGLRPVQVAGASQGTGPGEWTALAQ